MSHADSIIFTDIKRLIFFFKVNISAVKNPRILLFKVNLRCAVQKKTPQPAPASALRLSLIMWHFLYLFYPLGNFISFYRGRVPYEVVVRLVEGAQ